MKGNTSVPTSNAFISQKSDIIKAELAKYRLLKSQGSLLGHGETKETTSLPHNNNLSTIQSPSGDEASHSSVMALLQLNSSQGMLSVPKNEYQLNPQNKSIAQPSPSNSNPSSRVTRKSFGGVVDERDNAKLDHNSSYSSGSASRKFSGSQTPSANRFPPSKNSFNSVSGKKTNTVGKLTAQEEKQLNHLEDMIDAEIEKDLLSKVYPKTTNNTSRNLRSANTFVKDQREIVAPRRNPSVIEKRTPSAADVIDLDKRNRSSVQRDRSKKSSLPDVPTGYLSEDNTPNKVNRGLNVSRDLKNSVIKKKEERKTAAPTVGMEPDFKKTVLPGNVDENEGDLKEEIEKWRVFGKMMAESYDDLNRKYTDYLREKEKDKKIISALKDQVNTLKALLKTSKDENTRLKEMSTSESWSRTEESNKDLKEQKEMAQLTKDIESIKTESKDTMKMIEVLKLENQSLKKVLEEGQKQKDMTEYYQRLAEVRFKECSALAEEIICLRTDLDRSHSNYLRAQKESSAKKGVSDSFYSGKKMRLMGETASILSNLSSAVKPKNLNEKNVPAWDDESDIPPSPEEYSALPSKEEKLNMRG